MKKIFGYLLIIIIGSGTVYFGLLKFNEKDKTKKEEPKIVKSDKNETTIPSKDDFIEEAIKLQTLAENTNGNETCKCYDVKKLDHNTSMTGSILVYTVDDLFISSMWLSNGYYLLDGYETASSGLVEESNEKASLYCGEKSSSDISELCAKNY